MAMLGCVAEGSNYILILTTQMKSKLVVLYSVYFIMWVDLLSSFKILHVKYLRLASEKKCEKHPVQLLCVV